MTALLMRAAAMPAMCRGRQTIPQSVQERLSAHNRTELKHRVEAQLGHTGATGERLTADNHGFLRSTLLPDALASGA
jgi:hypothetical protein